MLNISYKQFVDVRVNSVCRNGMTHLGAVAQTGNLPLLKLLLDFHNYTNAPPNSKEKKKKPQYLQLDGNTPKRCKNVGYVIYKFIYCNYLY